MIVYSIQDIEKLSGVKAHTIRVWERRYSIITPKRTETNIRYYSDTDLKLILNIATLNKNGYKISKICKLSNEELITTVAELSSVDSAHEGNIDGLMFSMFELNESKFNRILDKHIKSKGILGAMDNVIYPFLDKISTMWFTGSIKSVHENFVSYIIRRKLVVAIDQISIKTPKASAILYLPENETQELTLLYIHYLLKSKQIKVVNLGVNVPLIDVAEAQEICHADSVFTLFNESFSDKSLQPYLEEMSLYVKGAKIFISGYQTVTQNLKLPDSVSILDSIASVEEIINQELLSLKSVKKSYS